MSIWHPKSFIWYQGQKVRSSTQACLQENLWPWDPPKIWVSSYFLRENEWIMNVFADCRCMQCGAIPHQRNQKLLSPTQHHYIKFTNAQVGQGESLVWPFFRFAPFIQNSFCLCDYLHLIWNIRNHSAKQRYCWTDRREHIRQLPALVWLLFNWHQQPLQKISVEIEKAESLCYNI